MRKPFDICSAVDLTRTKSEKFSFVFYNDNLPKLHISGTASNAP